MQIVIVGLCGSAYCILHTSGATSIESVCVLYFISFYDTTVEDERKKGVTSNIQIVMRVIII